MSTPGIDHIVIAVRTLEEAQAVFSDAGFTMTPRGEHVKLKGINSLAMLKTAYLEVAQPTAREAFGETLHTYMDEYGEGIAAVAFGYADVGAFASAAGLSYTDAFREVDTELHKGTAEFRLIGLPKGTLVGRHAFLIEHKTPELLWHPELETHANGALDVTKLTLRADSPADAAANCRRQLKLPEATGPTVDMDKNSLEFMTPDAMIARWGEQVHSVIAVATKHMTETRTVCGGRLAIEFIPQSA